MNKKVFDHKNPADYIKKATKGLTEKVVRKISAEKKEPKWMLEKRLEGLKLFHSIEMPQWGPSLSKLKFEDIIYYAVPENVTDSKTWDDVPKDIKNTFEKLGIPQAERAMLAGVGAQYESSVVYHNLKEEWEQQGVIFEDLDVAIKKHEKLVQQYFMKCVPVSLHKFTALHAAVWSGGTFLYIPKGVSITTPLQAYFRMNAKNMGQFEHTLIIIEENAKAHYIEGCSAPKYGSIALHAGCVEVYVKENAHFQYSSAENWSKDTYNLNTKKAIVEKNAHIQWVGGNMGSGVTMLYPCSVLQGEGSKAEHLGLAVAGEGQIQDTGAKVIHMAKNTTSTIVSKSMSSKGGITSYRGLVKVLPQATNVTTSVSCDALILDEKSISDTYPDMQIENDEVTISHEASVGKISEDELFYLMSRGIEQEEAISMIVNGFIEPIIKALPLEYAVEMNRLVEMEMEGSVG